MNRVKIAELRNHLSKHLRAVENGAEVIVTDRERPIAKIIPLESDHLRIKIIPAKGDFRSFRSRRFQPTGWGISLVELLMEDRAKR